MGLLSCPVCARKGSWLLSGGLTSFPLSHPVCGSLTNTSGMLWWRRGERVDGSCHGNPLTRHGHVTAYSDTSHPDRKRRPGLMKHNCKQLLFIFHKENMRDPAGEDGTPWNDELRWNDATLGAIQICKWVVSCKHQKTNHVFHIKPY